MTVSHLHRKYATLAKSNVTSALQQTNKSTGEMAEGSQSISNRGERIGAWPAQALLRGSTRISSNLLLTMCVLHWIAFGIMLSLHYQALSAAAAQGQHTLLQLRRTIAIGFPSVVRLLVAPFLDGSKALTRWLTLCVASMVMAVCISNLLRCDNETDAPCEPILPVKLLSHEVSLGVLFAGQAISDLIVSTFLINRPDAWFLSAPAFSVGGAIATQLPHWFKDGNVIRVEPLLVQVYVFQMVLVACVSYCAYAEPTFHKELFRRPEASSSTAKENSGIKVRDAKRSYRSMFFIGRYMAILKRAIDVLLRTPLMPWWSLMALLAPAIYAPARLRLTAAHRVTSVSPITIIGKPVGNAIAFYVARNLVVLKKYVAVLVAGYCIAAAITLWSPHATGDSAQDSLLWVLMDSLHVMFDTAEGYIYFAVAARLDGGLCATTLLAVQDVIFTIGEMFFVEITMWLADYYSLGCEPDVAGVRICIYDAFPTAAKCFCLLSLGLLVLLYHEGTLTRCFDVAHDMGWNDAGRVLKRSSASSRLSSPSRWSPRSSPSS
jgi:hypothetical protein